MPATIQSIIETWIYSTLSGSATVTAQISTRIYADEVPDAVDSPYPCAVMTFIAGDDLMIQSAVRVWTETLYQVGVWVENQTQATADSIYEIVDGLLHRGAGTVAGGQVYSCVRLQPLTKLETAQGGKKFRFSGGLYRIAAQPA